jgi:hypothetical protein
MAQAIKILYMCHTIRNKWGKTLSAGENTMSLLGWLKRKPKSSVTKAISDTERQEAEIRSCLNAIDTQYSTLGEALNEIPKRRVVPTRDALISLFRQLKVLVAATSRHQDAIRIIDASVETLESPNWGNIVMPYQKDELADKLGSLKNDSKTLRAYLSVRGTSFKPRYAAVRLRLSRFVGQYRSFEDLCLGNRTGSEANTVNALAECRALHTELSGIGKDLEDLKKIANPQEEEALGNSQDYITDLLGFFQSLESSGFRRIGTAQGFDAADTIRPTLDNISAMLGGLTARFGIAN